MNEERIYGSAPLVRLGEHCPACGRYQFGDHPILLITTDIVDEDFLEIVFEMIWEDDQGNVDWERLWEGSPGMDGYQADDGHCWLLPDQMDDPVFDKIKRGIRKMRREAA